MSHTGTSHRRTRTPLRVRAPYADFHHLGGRIGSGALGSGQGGVAGCRGQAPAAAAPSVPPPSSHVRAHLP